MLPYQIKSTLPVLLLALGLFLSSADAAPKATQAEVDALQAELRIVQQQLEQQSRVDLSAGLHIIQRRLQNMERELQDLRESNQRLRRQLSKFEERQLGANPQLSQSVITPAVKPANNSNSVFSAEETRSPISVDWAAVVSSTATESETNDVLTEGLDSRIETAAEERVEQVRSIEPVSLTVVAAEEEQKVNVSPKLAAEEELVEVNTTLSGVGIDQVTLNEASKPLPTESQDLFESLAENEEQDERLKNEQNQGQVENADIAKSKGVTSVMRETQDSSDTTNAYRDAFLLLKQGRYVESIEAFQQFLSTYPNSKYAANAQYWLAEAVYVRKQYAQALIEFSKVIDDYPGSSKVSDARLKVGYTFYELGRWKESREILTQLRAELPDSTVAGLAQQRIERLEREGR
ncbi:MAG: tol-pal system protein YbgF [Gammaproteobacteria bacterium]|nr:tol-pal system protein YbgF [Gammaproteobacteria bacterium]